MKNKVYEKEDLIIRVLVEEGERILVIDCGKASMPKWIKKDLEGFQILTEEDLRDRLGCCFDEMENLSSKAKKTMYERYSLISGVLPFLKEEGMRCKVIENISTEYGVSKQTIRRYLCLYLVYQDKRALAPVEKKEEKKLSPDEKNMRWSLNKFFYNKNRNSLKYAYTMMLKEKYCDERGELSEAYPTFH